MQGYKLPNSTGSAISGAAISGEISNYVNFYELRGNKR